MEAVEELRDGNTSLNIEVQGHDEIAQLMTDINEIANNIENSSTALASAHSQASGLIDTHQSLINGISQELRNPVAAINQRIQTLLENWKDVPPLTLIHDLEDVMNQASRLQMLIDDLFTLARAEMGQLELHPEETDAAALIHHSVNTLRPLAWKHARIEIIADLTSDLPAVFADVDRLNQIIHSLLYHAIRRTTPGGIIVISSHSDGDNLVIEVRDTGTGISPEDLPHIWERYQRPLERKEEIGTGIDLILVKEIGQAMNGIVEARSIPGEGNCLAIKLPLA
jgi:two-component system sensor histidine kinase BaeS